MGAGTKTFLSQMTKIDNTLQIRPASPNLVPFAHGRHLLPRFHVNLDHLEIPG